MQEIFFFDEGATPLPASEVHIEHAAAQPYTDGTRIQVTITLSPFQEKPNLGISIVDQNNETLVTAEVLEPISITTEITLHIKPSEPHLCHTLVVNLYYEENEYQDTKVVEFYPVGKSPTS